MAWEKNEPLKGPDGEPLSADVAESGPHDEKGYSAVSLFWLDLTHSFSPCKPFSS
jgi:hypothetical protein